MTLDMSGCMARKGRSDNPNTASCYTAFEARAHDSSSTKVSSTSGVPSHSRSSSTTIRDTFDNEARTSKRSRGESHSVSVWPNVDIESVGDTRQGSLSADSESFPKDQVSKVIRTGASNPSKYKKEVVRTTSSNPSKYEAHELEEMGLVPRGYQFPLNYRIPREKSMRRGRWTTEEHDAFLRGLAAYGRTWTKVAEMVGTRSASQVRSHAQKFDLRIAKKLDKLAKDQGDPKLSGALYTNKSKDKDHVDSATSGSEDDFGSEDDSDDEHRRTRRDSRKLELASLEEHQISAKALLGGSSEATSSSRVRLRETNFLHPSQGPVYTLHSGSNIPSAGMIPAILESPPIETVYADPGKREVGGSTVFQQPASFRYSFSDMTNAKSAPMVDQAQPNVHLQQISLEQQHLASTPRTVHPMMMPQQCHHINHLVMIPSHHVPQHSIILPPPQSAHPMPLPPSCVDSMKSLQWAAPHYGNARSADSAAASAALPHFHSAYWGPPQTELPQMSQHHHQELAKQDQHRRQQRSSVALLNSRNIGLQSRYTSELSKSGLSADAATPLPRTRALPAPAEASNSAILLPTTGEWGGKSRAI